MTNTAFDYAIDTTAAEPYLDHWTDLGWMLGSVDGQPIITFIDGSAPIEGVEAVRIHITAHTGESIMPTKQANHIDESADDATGIIEKYGNPTLSYIGNTATSAAAVLQVKRPWNDLARGNVITRVTMDTEPEQPGRPRPGRPGVEQIVFMVLPDWHPLFQSGQQEAVAMLYRPASTYIADRIVGDKVEKEQVASGFDVNGWIGIVEYFGNLDRATEEASELRNAVKAMSQTELNSEEADASTVDPVAGRYGDRSAWGV